MNKTLGGVVVVALGVLVVGGMGIVAMNSLTDNNGKDLIALVTGVGGVVGTLVGAFFGVSITAESRDKAETARDEAVQKKDIATGGLAEVGLLSAADSPQGQIVRRTQEQLRV